MSQPRPHARSYRRAPRGRPSIGFQLDIPVELELQDGPELRCREVRQDGAVVGELEVSLFAAALVIDRDGILAERAVEGLKRLTTLTREVVASPVALPGANGFRTAVV